MTDKIEQEIEKLGFLPKETTVYLELLKRGSLTPHQLESITGVNRTTVYSVTKSLLAKGIISEERGASKKKFTADPEQLTALMDDERKRLVEREKVVAKLVPELNKINLGSQFAIPKIQYVEEKKIERYLYKNTDKLNESALKYDGTWWGFQDYRFVEHYLNWINDYWTMQSSKKTYGRILSNESNIEAKMAKVGLARRQIKFWDSDEFTGSLWIVGDYIVMIMTHEHPFYLIEIHDQVLARNMREVFKKLWKVAV